MIILSAIDNLIKGGGGQAIQNMIYYLILNKVWDSMRHVLILLLFFLQNCSTTASNNNDKGLKINIYENDMTYENLKKL